MTNNLANNLPIETLGTSVALELILPTEEDLARGERPILFIGQGDDTIAISADDVSTLIRVLQHTERRLAAA